MHVDDGHDDDAPIGRVLTRREAIVLLGGLGASGVLFLVGCDSGDTTGLIGADETPSASTGCAAKPALTEGPYFVDEKLNRSDIRTNTPTGVARAGAPFVLDFVVSRIQSNACTAFPAAQVDVWHCDAAGVYSDAADPGFNTQGQNWLRGYQLTDATGTARFTTIFPGWYQGRATHIHFKIRGTNTAGAAFAFTSQLFFAESFLTQIYATVPYSSRNDAGRLRNASDGIYAQGGSQLLLAPAASGGGYTGTLNIGLYV